VNLAVTSSVRSWAYYRGGGGSAMRNSGDPRHPRCNSELWATSVQPEDQPRRTPEPSPVHNVGSDRRWSSSSLTRLCSVVSLRYGGGHEDRETRGIRRAWGRSCL
jgi:hypothetical protein